MWNEAKKVTRGVFGSIHWVVGDTIYYDEGDSELSLYTFSTTLGFVGLQGSGAICPCMK